MAAPVIEGVRVPDDASDLVVHRYSTVQCSTVQCSTVYLVSVAQEREVHPQLLPPRRLDRLHQAGGAEEDVGG